MLKIQTERWCYEMDDDFQKWLEKRNASWYLLSNSQYEWYLNQFIDEIEVKRKEQKEDEQMVY